MIELRQLRHFVTVCEELHFRRAAERLGMSQPPLTQSIQAIERELGVKLLERSRRGVVITRAGILLLAEARATLLQAERMALVARQVAHGDVGTLRVAFSISAPFARPFTRALHAFQRTYPSVTLELQRTSGTAWAGLLERNEVDVCVTRPLSPLQLPAGLRAVVIQRDDLMLLLPSRHALARRKILSLPDLAAEPFILHPRESRTAVLQQIMLMFAEAGVRPRISHELTDAPTIMGLVAASVGASILPSSLRLIGIDDIAWRPIQASRSLVETAIVAIYPARAQTEMPQKAFIGLLENLAENKA